MPATVPQFDAERLVHFVTLFDSPEDGEAQNALIQARRLLQKSHIGLVDAFETDAYFEAITRQVKPSLKRSVRTDDQALHSLRAANDRLADQLANEQAMSKAEVDRLARQLADQQEINVRLLRKTRGSGSRSRKRLKVLMVLLLLGALALVHERVPFGTDSDTCKKFEAIKHKAAREMGIRQTTGTSQCPDRR